MILKLHPDLLAHVQERAEAEYCSAAEYVRRLIIADKRATSSEGEDSKPRKIVTQFGVTERQ